MNLHEVLFDCEKVGAWQKTWSEIASYCTHLISFAHEEKDQSYILLILFLNYRVDLEGFPYDSD